MKIRRFLLAVLFLAFVCDISMGFGLHRIPQDEPVIDGAVGIGSSEWEGVVWQALDKAYNGSAPADVLHAQWAAKWSPATNLIYVAVVVFDPNQVFTSAWAGATSQDYIAVCVDAANSDAAAQAGNNTYMQQWNVGANGSGGAWAVLGNGTAIPAGDLAAYAVAVNGMKVTYELAIKPYASYSTSGGSQIMTMELDDVVGLDVVLCSRNPAGVFGMFANDANADKFNDASKLIDHRISILGECTVAAPGDFDQNCDVTLDDFSVIAENWLVDTTTVPTAPVIGAPVFSGTWGSGYYYRWPRKYSGVAGSSVSCMFAGTGIRILGNTYSNGGPGEVYIDGVYQGTISFLGYNNLPVWFAFENLANTEHLIELKVPTPAAGNVLFVAFKPLNPGPWSVTGTWSGHDAQFESDIFLYTSGAGNTWSCDFKGTGVQYIASSYFDSGIAGITIDGGTEEMVDLYQAGKANGAKFTWTKTGLSSGNHNIVIRCTGTRGTTGSSGNVVSVVEIKPVN